MHNILPTAQAKINNMKRELDLLKKYDVLPIFTNGTNDLIIKHAINYFGSWKYFSLLNQENINDTL